MGVEWNLTDSWEQWEWPENYDKARKAKQDINWPSLAPPASKRCQVANVITYNAVMCACFEGGQWQMAVLLQPVLHILTPQKEIQTIFVEGRH